MFIASFDSTNQIMQVETAVIKLEIAQSVEPQLATTVVTKVM